MTLNTKESLFRALSAPGGRKAAWLFACGTAAACLLVFMGYPMAFLLPVLAALPLAVLAGAAAGCVKGDADSILLSDADWKTARRSCFLCAAIGWCAVSGVSLLLAEPATLALCVALAVFWFLSPVPGTVRERFSSMPSPSAEMDFLMPFSAPFWVPRAITWTGFSVFLACRDMPAPLWGIPLGPGAWAAVNLGVVLPLVVIGTFMSGRALVAMDEGGTVASAGSLRRERFGDENGFVSFIGGGAGVLALVIILFAADLSAKAGYPAPTWSWPLAGMILPAVFWSLVLSVIGVFRSRTAKRAGTFAGEAMGNAMGAVIGWVMAPVSRLSVKALSVSVECPVADREKR